MPKQEKITLNKYDRMRLKYLKENKKAEYSMMLMDGKLNSHLKEIQVTATEREEQIIKQLKSKSNLTEDIKNTDMLYWVGTMNAIKNQAEEIVFNELIYVQEMMQMKNLREVKDDLLKEWLEFRDETVFCEMTPQDKKYCIYFDEIAEKILKNVPVQNKKHVKKQLEQLEKNFTDYLYYWNEKYYRNGFADVIELLEI